MVEVVVLFCSKEYCLSCDQQCLPEANLVTAGMNTAVCHQDCKMKVRFGRAVCGTTFVEPSSLPVGRGSG